MSTQFYSLLSKAIATVADVTEHISKDPSVLESKNGTNDCLPIHAVGEAINMTDTDVVQAVVSAFPDGASVPNRLGDLALHKVGYKVKIIEKFTTRFNAVHLNMCRHVQQFQGKKFSSTLTTFI